MSPERYGDFNGILPAGEVIAYQTDGSYDFNAPVSSPGFLRSSRIVKSRPLNDEQAARFRTILADSASLGGGPPMRCFMPGLGFTLGSGIDTLDILVCLRCLWVRFYRGEEQSYEVLSESGQRAMQRFYSDLF